MPKQKPSTGMIELDQTILEQARKIKAKTGVPIKQQIQAALVMYWPFLLEAWPKIEEIQEMFDKMQKAKTKEAKMITK